MRPLLRPLPLSIAAMLLLGTVKLVGLVQALGPSLALAGASAGRTVLPSALAAETRPHEDASAKAEPKPLPPVPAAPVPALPVSAAPVSATPVPAAPVPPPVPAAPGPSDAERALLQDLRTRRDALDTRERTLEARDGLLKAAERGLSDRLEQLAAMQVRLEALEKARREHAEANWNGLVKTYEAMRPRDAAAIFNDLEQSVLMPVLDRMKEAKAAPILAAMQPDRARAATAQLAQWRTRPQGGPQG